MKTYNLQTHLNDLYASFPEGNRQPLIGITANFNDGEAQLGQYYFKQIVEAGGTPILIPPVSDKNVLVNTLEHIDGLLLSGGADINPLWAGEEPSTQLGHINATRDLPELLITQLAYNRQIPILGICRGIQTLAVALGGKVEQDIYSKNGQRGATIRHSQDADRNEKTHSVEIAEDSILHHLYQADRIFVNSFHHQAIAEPGKRFRVTAKAPDGVVEAIESREFKQVMGVQWHPENLGEDGLKLFQWLVNQATNFHTAKRLHSRILTLDTHCDTPMFFPQGIHFEQRDPHILVDLHKMTDGRQDAVIMAAYLPQPKMGESFSSKVTIVEDPDTDAANGRPASASQQQITPLRYADYVFDKIENIVAKNNRYMSLARRPADLYEDKRKGRKSIMLAIENGLALEHDLKNLRHFAQRGIVYMTLCHNGDNDICDSARGCNTHNGVSQFGEKVIMEMNRLGIMVDLSHANEKSFYDALEISSRPIVCSHSSARSLCDHPRNLTDDQMRALAKKGGVAQTTLYPGFLRKDSEATVLDAIAHLEHAIRIMGIDHVGIGTDFDGDGGVRGFADSSETIAFTLQLLRRKYSERDIEKIWGGNWLRVMKAIQEGSRK